MQQLVALAWCTNMVQCWCTIVVHRPPDRESYANRNVKDQLITTTTQLGTLCAPSFKPSSLIHAPSNSSGRRGAVAKGTAPRHNRHVDQQTTRSTLRSVM